uniref:Uncharacterized protein n=1 Tax=Phaeomonas parva TaxID=124430 RepID=A0A7S1XMM3_9STRA|mmetsp:Transcript_16985/g.52146  ORF Transcript_16985/g.52146 Transcript_16985/m.52146 type:complete len:222 (+) Transcript_16985:335-1000(+)
MGLAGCDHAEFTCGAACERRLEEAPAAGIRPEGTCRGSKICDCSRAGHSCVCGAPGAGQNGCCNMGCGGCEAACDGAPPPPARPGGAAEQRLEAAPPVGYEPAPLEAATDCAAHLSCGKCVAGGCAWCVADRVCRDDKPWQCQGDTDHVSISGVGKLSECPARKPNPSRYLSAGAGADAGAGGAHFELHAPATSEKIRMACLDAITDGVGWTPESVSKGSY